MKSYQDIVAETPMKSVPSVALPSLSKTGIEEIPQHLYRLSPAGIREILHWLRIDKENIKQADEISLSG